MSDLKDILAGHAAVGSARASAILERWPASAAEFLFVEPITAGVTTLTHHPPPSPIATEPTPARR